MESGLGDRRRQVLREMCLEFVFCEFSGFVGRKSSMLHRLWVEDEGVLTFEWVVLLTLLVIGVIGGVAAIRDAIIHESQGSVGAILDLDYSYFISAPLAVSVSGGPSDTNCTSSSVWSFGYVANANWGVLQGNGSERVDTTPINETGSPIPTSNLCPLP